MDYKKIYDQLIANALEFPKDDLYKEKHHIIPKCLGGTNNKKNIVKLTAKQHFLAHWLLYKIYKTPALAYAWFSMCRIGIGMEQRNINSRIFEYAKKIRSKFLSEYFKGNRNNFFGKKHSKQSIEKMIISHTGHITSDDTKKLMSKQRKGKIKTKEHKEKIGRKGLIPLVNIVTGKNIRINKENIHLYNNNVWVFTKIFYKEKKYKCNYCDMVTTKGNLNRWHNENCKNKKY